MKICVVGTGYVGLVSGVCLAAKGHNVTCVDIDPAVVDKLGAGKTTIYEPGLDELLTRVHDEDRFRASRDLASALDGASAALVAVGTPSSDGVIDLRYIREASRSIGSYLRDNDRFLSIIVKSTVVPGTTDTVVRGEVEKASGRRLGQFGLGMNPEFLREGAAVEDFMFPDRIVLGFEDERTLALLEDMYAPWDVDKLRVNTRTAELIKYANNAILATQISAINEIANVAAAANGIDVMDVVRGVTLDKRWNPMTNGARVMPSILSYLVPGCGFGGSCFPKDLQALRSFGRAHGVNMRVTQAVLEVNEEQPYQVAEILQRQLSDLNDKNCLVLGLAFKPETDDVRESASIKIVESLLARGASVMAHDPIAAPNFRRALGSDAERVAFVADWRAQVASADVIVIATRWAEYDALRGCDTAGKVVFDARRMFNPAAFAQANYLAIGLNKSAAP